MTKPQYDESVKPVSYEDTNLFKPIKLGDIELSHRVVLAPLTRLRSAAETFVPNVELATEYYSQRSKTPGTLVITEGILVSKFVSGFFDGVSGIWSDEQVEAWTVIFKRVKENHSFVVVQLYGLGRQAIPDILAKDGIPYKAATAGEYIVDKSAYNYEEKAIESGNPLGALTVEEIEQHIKDFIQAGKNSILAGADGVQVHVANGYLLNQFLDPDSNKRVDEYGGSIENRSRLPLRIIDGLIDAIGANKVSIRLSPHSLYAGLKGADSDPTLIAQYAHLVGELELRARQGNRLQFIDIVEPRVFGGTSLDDSVEYKGPTNKFFYDLWKGPVVRAGNYIANPQAIKEDVADGRTLIAFGRYFISNPDLPDRLKNGYPLNKYNRDTFYTRGAEGYNDYSGFTK